MRREAEPAQDLGNYATAPVQERYDEAPAVREQRIEQGERDLHRNYHQDPSYQYTSHQIRRASRERGTFYDGYRVERPEVSVREVVRGPEVFEDHRQDVFELESQMKRDYQKKLDDYHRFVAEANYHDKSKSVVKRIEAEVAKQRAALYEEEKRLEKLNNKELKRRYREELDIHSGVHHRTIDQEREIELSAEKYARPNYNEEKLIEKQRAREAKLRYRDEIQENAGVQDRTQQQEREVELAAEQ